MVLKVSDVWRKSFHLLRNAFNFLWLKARTNERSRKSCGVNVFCCFASGIIAIVMWGAHKRARNGFHFPNFECELEGVIFIEYKSSSEVNKVIGNSIILSSYPDKIFTSGSWLIMGMLSRVN